VREIDGDETDGPDDIRIDLVAADLITPRVTEKDHVFIGLARSARDFSDCETRAFHPLHDIITTALDYQRRVQAIQAKINTNAIGARPAHLSLTERETQVLALIAAGYTNDQAARRLGISPRTMQCVAAT
jgi:DNA-binding NarL/FixJ family response regulator